MPNIKIDKNLLQKSSEQVEDELLGVLTDQDQFKPNVVIKFGITENGTTNFENLICPYCHNTVPWEDFYNDVDTMDILDTDASASGSFTCPHCEQEMDVFLNVLVHAEKKE